MKLKRSDLPADRFGKSADVHAGKNAIAMGGPFVYANSIILGARSGLGRSLDPSDHGASGTVATSPVDFIQTDAAISPGSSGQVLVDAHGLLVAMNVAYLGSSDTEAESIGFAISADTVTTVVDQLIEKGTASHAYLGIGSTSMSTQLQTRYGLARSEGVLVTSVAQGSPAATAGLQQGGIITGIDGKAVEEQADLVVCLRAASPDDSITIKVDRSGTGLVLTAKLSELPGAQS